jgi:hypothetical protein
MDGDTLLTEGLLSSSRSPSSHCVGEAPLKCREKGPHVEHIPIMPDVYS